jgi:nitroreductase
MILKIKQYIQNFFSITYIKTIFNFINLIIFFFVSRLGIISAFFMSFINFSFIREQHAVTSGIYKFYYRSIKKINWSLIRRNTHRIEKGLIMKPQKKIFALNYIEETVNEYLKLEKNNENHTVKWCTDILDTFFNTIQLNDKTKKLKNKFDNHKLKFEIPFDNDDKRNNHNEKYTPYFKENYLSKVKYEDLYQLSVNRRSVRYFKPNKIDKNILDKALLIARQAPSACNRAPYKYIFFNDSNMASEIASIPFGTIGYSHQIPCLAVLVGDLSLFASSRDRHNIYVDSSLSAMSFIFALETLGLSSCCINWPDFLPLEIKMSKKLKLKSYERVIMLIAIGYADYQSKVCFSKKKELNEISIFHKK